MYFPSATYRIQTYAEFPLKEIKKIISYLDDLGITTIYSAPFFEAGKDSTHGYDVVNPHTIGKSIGDEAILRDIAKALKKRKMGWLQDIVPNHMAFTAYNPWIRNVLELGSLSPYYAFFDINWVSEDPDLFGKVMMPFLGNPLEEVLHNKEIQLSFGENGLYFSYFTHEFPLNAGSYYLLLEKQSKFVQQQNPDEEIQKQYFSLLFELEKWTQEAPHQDAYDQWEVDKKALQKLCQKSRVIRQVVLEVVEAINGDQEALKQLLTTQYYLPAYWKETESRINYRRFFTVNDLICLNIQEAHVFQVYHQFIKKLVDQDLVQGLRVDHVDGLFDPTQYLERLRALTGEDTYIVVEKILEAGEPFPKHWPIEGTSGYEFLADVSQLFTARQGEDQLTRFYKSITPRQPAYPNLIFQKKMFILLHRMGGELDNLLALLQTLDILPDKDTANDKIKLKQALAHLLAAFPVYRVYGNSYPFSDQEMKVIGEAFAFAQEKAPDLGQYFERLREIFNGVADRDEQQNQNRLYFVMRCQQFTGPLAAKGVEDTTFYGYNRLISHNEVGDTPHIFGFRIEDFHQRMQERLPHSMNTTATHDTKRGEDARLRINMLAEIPDAWEEHYHAWHEMNLQFLTEKQGKISPDANDEYFLYQTLVGTYPVHLKPEEENYQERLCDYMLKAIKEAKRNTSWSDPDEAYEDAVQHFVEKILNHAPFIASLQPFMHQVATLAAVYSLGQTVIKVMAPGIPDVYQGTEFWDLSMVDPDNRRPVNYQERTHKLEQLKKALAADPLKLVKRLRGDLLDPTIKLFTLYQALQVRKQHHDFFLKADYQPLTVTGSQSENLLAFVRTWQQEQIIVIVPMHIATLSLTENLPLGAACWKDTQLTATQSLEGTWYNAFTDEKLTLDKQIPVSQVLNEFPIALLIKTIL